MFTAGCVVFLPQVGQEYVEREISTCIAHTQLHGHLPLRRPNQVTIKGQIDRIFEALLSPENGCDYTQITRNLPVNMRTAKS